jgi:fructose-bisphosphate aldolase class 1
MQIYGYIMKNNSITTVKVDKSLYESFKIKNIKNKFYLQDLVNRCMYLYMNDETFRNKIYNFNIPILSEESQLTILNFTGSSIPKE